MAEFFTAQFWFAVGSIIMIDILLGGDNAVVIALACRRLAPAQRLKGVVLGTAGAIVLRVVLIFFALELLRLPFLKVVGALLLLVIGAKLLLPEPPDDHEGIQASDKLWKAVKTIIVADLVMSVDNVIAIASAAQGAHQDHHMLLVVFGLVVSVPIIVWGSQFVMKLMDRFPLIITLGGMLLGWIAGTMAVADQFIAQHVWPAAWVEVSQQTQVYEPVAVLHYIGGVAGVIGVLLCARILHKMLKNKKNKGTHE